MTRVVQVLFLDSCAHFYYNGIFARAFGTGNASRYTFITKGFLRTFF